MYHIIYPGYIISYCSTPAPCSPRCMLLALALAFLLSQTSLRFNFFTTSRAPPTHVSSFIAQS